VLLMTTLAVFADNAFRSTPSARDLYAPPLSHQLHHHAYPQSRPSPRAAAESPPQSTAGAGAWELGRDATVASGLSWSWSFELVACLVAFTAAAFVVWLAVLSARDDI